MAKTPPRKVAVKKKAATQQPAKSVVRSPEAIAREYEQTWRGPFVQDTLGVPRGVQMVTDDINDDTMMAQYEGNTIYANARNDPNARRNEGAMPADSPSVRNILTHELGHAKESPTTFPSYFAVNRPMVQEPDGKSKAEDDAKYAISPYYRENPSEAFAQSFVNASDYLSKTAADTAGYREKLGQYEGNTPGAGAIVRDLFVGNPIYKNHPLKGLIR